MIRIFIVNPNRYGSDLIDKMNQFKRAINEMNIDYILLSSLDRKLRLLNEATVKNQMKLVLKNIKLFTVDTGTFKYKSS